MWKYCMQIIAAITSSSSSREQHKLRFVCIQCVFEIIKYSLENVKRMLQVMQLWLEQNWQYSTIFCHPHSNVLYITVSSKWDNIININCKKNWTELRPNLGEHPQLLVKHLNKQFPCLLTVAGQIGNSGTMQALDLKPILIQVCKSK